MERLAGTRRRIAAAVFVALLCGLFGWVAAVPASAHAMLDRTSPGADTVVARAPGTVSVTFSEAVTVVPGSVRVYDGALHEVDTGAAAHVDGDPTTVGVGVEPALAAGTYTVTWRVVSADSHPVSGGFRFSVGHPGPTAAPPPPESGGGAAGALLAVARFVEYVGLAAVGGAAVLVALRGAGADVEVQRRARRGVVAGWWALLVGTALALLLQGPDAAGVGLGSVLDPTVLATAVDSPTGGLLLARLVLVLVAGAAGRRLVAAVPVAEAPPPAGERAVLVTVALVAAAATFSASGHAGVDAPVVLGLAVDLAHLTAMSLWIGGLVVLLLALRRRAEATILAPVAAVLPRFSRGAQIAVGVIVATGLYQTWRDVVEPGALVTTTYGWLLIAKVAAVVVLLVLGDRARRLVAGRLVARPVTVPRRGTERAAAPGRPRSFALSLGPAPSSSNPAPASSETESEPSEPPEPPSSGWRRSDVRRQQRTIADGPPPPGLDLPSASTLRRGLLAEAAIAVVVLAVTAVLVGSPQATETYAPAFTSTATAGGLALTTDVDAAHTGSTAVHLTGRDSAGRAVPVSVVEASLTLPAQGIGPLPVTAAPGPGGRVGAPLSFAVPGDWALDVTVASPVAPPTLFRVVIPVR
ncbi:copper resistance protein CopC [Actinomycetospora endophytica]|uniref:Copper resistance protein CopC n=1 Tax=Actinomycetospora endophytica TaxID=2291215 RepID=A0ABS8PCJ3_9PSEU|nr:copper resistance protein CopC [Actinomycetospora endophytica]MCD2195998.1 copper resistance protein CopC [Actinomycetospora endophytica]